MVEAPSARSTPNLRAIAMLVLCCACWGVSFPLMQMAADGVARAAGWMQRTPLEDVALRATYTGWRFFAAALLYYLLTYRRQHGFQRVELRGGVIASLFFAVGVLLQMSGLRYALPSVSAVLTSLTVVFTPIAQALIVKRPVGRRTWQAVVIALAGVCILSFPNPAAAARLTLAVPSPIPWLGEGATVVASILFTGQVLSIDRYGRESDSARLTMVMFLTGAAISTVIGLLAGGSHLYDLGVLAAIVNDPRFWPVTLGIVVISSVGAFHLMNTAQPKVSPAVASVAYCTEPVFATAWSLALGTESVTWLTLVGGSLVILAMLNLTRGG